MYSYISSIKGTACLKQARKMGLGIGIGSAIEGAVGGAIGDTIGNALGIGGNQRQEQKEMTEDAARINYEYGEKAADAAWRRQMSLYEKSRQDQSYESRVRDMEKAGLSVGLMYGGGQSGGGAGIASAAPQGSGASGQAAGRAANRAERQQAATAAAQMAINNRSMMADIELKEANAELAKAEAKKLSGVDTDVATATYQNILQETQNKMAVEAGQKLQNSMAKIDLLIKDLTKDMSVEKIRYEVSQAHFDMLTALNTVRKSGVEANVAEAIESKMIESYNADLMQKYVNITLAQSQTALNKAEVEKAWAIIKDLSLQRDLKMEDQKNFRDSLRNALEIAGIHYDAQIHGEIIEQAGKLLSSFAGQFLTPSRAKVGF